AQSSTSDLVPPARGRGIRHEKGPSRARPFSKEYAPLMAEVAASDAAVTDEFDARVDHLLQCSCEVARALTGSHQAAMAMVVGGDWTQARKYFSLSDKYAEWKDF